MFLFNTWIGGVICSFVALCIVGGPILAWINKEKAAAKNECQRLKEQLHKHTSSNQDQSKRY
jgi:hypothetical protein